MCYCTSRYTTVRGHQYIHTVRLHGHHTARHRDVRMQMMPSSCVGQCFQRAWCRASNNMTQPLQLGIIPLKGIVCIRYGILSFFFLFCFVFWLLLIGHELQYGHFVRCIAFFCSYYTCRYRLHHHGNPARRLHPQCKIHVHDNSMCASNHAGSAFFQFFFNHADVSLIHSDGCGVPHSRWMSFYADTRTIYVWMMSHVHSHAHTRSHAHTHTQKATRGPHHA